MASLSPKTAHIPRTDSGVSDFRCFATLSSALAYATDGKVKLEPTARTVERSRLEAAGAVSTAAALVAGPILGIQYANRNFGGSTLVLAGSSGPGCVRGTSYTFSDLSRYHFDNQIASTRLYSNCIARYHAGKNLNGDSRYCDNAQCGSLGGMNNRASSIKFF